MQDKGEAHTCPRCGYREDTPPAAPHYLRPGTVLAGKYLVGKGLGHGGFGTTYLAYDLVLGIKLAIKEYLPQDCASRAPGQAQVTPFSGEGEKRFNQGLESFLQEARTLARFDGQPGIVGVRDFFTENNTAYLVMNYLEGITLKDVLVGRGGKPMPFDQLMKIMLPVMSALERVHAAGLLHRDVSPDNIFLTKQGQVVLIDFGAARQSMGVQRSMSVILKPGYAPQEQYRSHGRQGPWTDVYALGACMYRALTGVIPPEALERTPVDTLQPPSRLGAQMPRQAEEALLKAMAVEAEDRFQNVAAFRRALLGPGAAKSAQQGGQAAPRPAQRREGRAQQPQPSAGRTTRAKEPQTYPLKARKRRSPAAGVLVALMLLALLAAVVVIMVYLMQRTLNDLPLPETNGGNVETSTTAPQESPEEPTPTPSATQEPQSQEPSPSPTDDYEGPEEMRPGATPSASLSSFVPKSYTYVLVESGQTQEGWLCGRMPLTRPDVLCASFVYDMDQMEPVGEVYYYFLDAVGNLKYGSAETQEYATLLPAKCAVGETYTGAYGKCEVVAVNYSVTVGDTHISNAVVVKSDKGYLFFVPDLGLAMIREGLDSGEVTQRVLSQESVEQSLFERYITP